MLTFTQVWNALGPEIVLAIGGFVAMVYEFMVTGRAKQGTPWIAVLSVLTAIPLAWSKLHAPLATYSIAVIAVDDFGTIFSLFILVSVLLVLLFAIASQARLKLAFEYAYLVLFATVGAMVICSALDLVTLYVGLELLSITTYVLVALHRKNVKSSEAGLKYLIIGSIASAIILYGLSFLYGVAGSTGLSRIATALQGGYGSEPGLVYLSIALILAGIFVKISAAPFHLWTADVYEGAPTPITAYLAVVSKGAVLGFLFRVIVWLFGAKLGEWFGLVGWIAIITMVIGNLGALSQRNIKRLLAYSSIGQAGYLLIPFSSLSSSTLASVMWQNLSSTVFYLFAYSFMTIGAFAVFSVVADASGSEDVHAFTGLSKRSPWLAGMMTLFLLSLSGLPLTAGFFGKFSIFLGALGAGQIWLGVVLFATSAIAFYYYFGIIRAMYGRTQEGDASPVRSSPMQHVVVALCAIGTLWLGIFPGPVTDLLSNLHWFG